MPQLDIMTFSVQASSIMIASLFLYFFFYFVLLPTISVALFCRQLIKIQLISEDKSTNKIIKKGKKINLLLKKEINNLCKKFKNMVISFADWRFLNNNYVINTFLIDNIISNDNNINNVSSLTLENELLNLVIIDDETDDCIEQDENNDNCDDE